MSPNDPQPLAALGTREHREQRLLSDLEALQALAAESTIFTLETTSDPPERYLLSFHGKGLAPEPSAKEGAKTIERHQCDLRLPYSYPERPPDIRWLTPLLHPNVSFAGCIHLDDIGLPWTHETGLDSLCERLWDMARLAYVENDRAVNYSAKNWLDAHPDVNRPVDPRPLRDKTAGKQSSVNIVRYERRGSGRKALAALAAPPPAADLFYIGDDTPAIRPGGRPARGDDILFIDE